MELGDLLVDVRPRVLHGWDRAVARLLSDREPGSEKSTELVSRFLDRLILGLQGQAPVSMDDELCGDGAEITLLRNVLFEELVRAGAGLNELRTLNRVFDQAMVDCVRRQADARERTLATLDRFSQGAMGQSRLESFLPALLGALQQANPDFVFVSVLRREGDVLRGRAEVGLHVRDWDEHMCPVGVGFAGRIAQEQRPLELLPGEAATATTAIERRLIAAVGARSLYGVPLMHDGQVVGVAKTGSRSSDGLSSEDKRLFRTLADRVTALVIQAQLIEAQRRSEELLEAILDSATAIIQVKDAHGRYLRVNRRFEAAFGRDRRSVLGRTAYELYPPEVARTLLANDQEVLRTGEPEEGEETILLQDGPHTFLSLKYPLRDANGHPYAVAGIATDITERSRLLEQIQLARAEAERSLAVLDAIFASAPVGLAVIDREARYVRANEELARINGRSLEEHLGRSVCDVIPDVAPVVMGLVQRIFQTGEPLLGMDVTVPPPRTADAARHGIVSLYPVRLSDGEIYGVGAAIVDITRQKDTQARAAFLSRVTAALADSLDYRITLARVAELCIQGVADWCVIHVLEDDALIHCVAIAHRDQTHVEELRSIFERYPARQDAGGLVPQVLRTGVARLSDPLSEADKLSLARSDEHAEFLRGLQLGAILMLPMAARGRTFGVVALTMAESGRHFADEDRELAEELVRRASLAVDNARLYKEAQEAVRARDDFLSMASHDLRSPLASLRLQTHMLLDRARKSAEGSPGNGMAESLALVDRQVTRVAEMLDTLLDVSRIHAGRLTLTLKEIDLAEVTRNVAEAMRETLRSAGCPLKLSASDRVVGRWDPMRLEEVAMNLISNAAKYGAGAPVEVAAWKEDGYGWLRVTDHGVGIAPEQQSKLFQRFERVGDKSAFRGTGLGLWIVRRIVEAMEGTIEVQSAPGQGATFLVKLPIRSKERPE